jgi:hypothetical protein
MPHVGKKDLNRTDITSSKKVVAKPSPPTEPPKTYKEHRELAKRNLREGYLAVTGQPKDKPSPPPKATKTLKSISIPGLAPEEGKGPPIYPVTFSFKDKPKDKKGKYMPHLVCESLTEAIARVREYGVVKYKGEGGWQQQTPLDYMDAIGRHYDKCRSDPKARDEESGLLHIAQIATDAMFVIQMLVEGGEKLTAAISEERTKSSTLCDSCADDCKNESVTKCNGYIRRIDNAK